MKITIEGIEGMEDRPLKPGQLVLTSGGGYLVGETDKDECGGYYTMLISVKESDAMTCYIVDNLIKATTEGLRIWIGEHLDEDVKEVLDKTELILKC